MSGRHLDLEKLACLSIGTVYHVGEIREGQSGPNRDRFSLEGPTLSVSRCPHAWQRIARPLIGPCFEMTRGDGLFLSMFDVRGNADLVRRIIRWGEAAGYCERREVWVLSWYDDEYEEDRAMSFETREEAIDEAADGCGDLDLRSSRRPCPTDRTLRMFGFGDDQAANDATEETILLWAMENLADWLDGVWWEENYDPMALSAPRGGIFPRRLSRWRRTEIDDASVEDDERACPASPVDVEVVVRVDGTVEWPGAPAPRAKTDGNADGPSP